jgi:hypothetical protein
MVLNYRNIQFIVEIQISKNFYSILTNHNHNVNAIYQVDISFDQNLDETELCLSTSYCALTMVQYHIVTFLALYQMFYS